MKNLSRDAILLLYDACMMMMYPFSTGAFLLFLVVGITILVTAFVVIWFFRLPRSQSSVRFLVVSFNSAKASFEDPNAVQLHPF